MARLKGLAALLVLALLAAPAPHANAQAPVPGVVRAVMYWMSTCGHCHYVLTEVLPPIQQHYGAQFELRLIEVTTSPDVDELMAAGVAYGYPRGSIGVPLLLIGDRALMGSEEIPEHLPGLIEHYLALGGVDWPDPAGPAVDTGPAPAASVPTPNGFALAIAVLAGMAGTLAGVAAGLARGLKRRRTRPAPRWVGWAVSLLALAGLGVAGYLAYVETQAVRAVCGPVGDCNAVQASSYARLFGILPVGVVGLAGYLAILAAWGWPRLSAHPSVRCAPVAVFGMAVGGVLFSLYLTYLELFVIGAVCLWCLSSAVIITLLMASSLPAALPVLASWRRRSRGAGRGMRRHHAD